MNIKIYLCLITACKVTTANNWTVNDEGQCFYTVISTNLSAIVTNKISMCDFAEPYVTFIITNSTNENVTSDFFNTTFNSWVRLLKADNNNWANVFSLAFRNFKNVFYIDLSKNHIKKLGIAFKGLEALDFLNLSRNHIEDINSETFTISENVTRLHLLDLSYNLLSHLPKNVFLNLRNLRMLHLQGNKITILGEVFYKSLSNLVYLNLCCNNLTKLDMTLNYLTSLIDLDLSSNNITNLNKYTFAGLISLQSIDLSNNKIASLPLGFLEEAISLTNINLSFNKINNIFSDPNFHSINNTEKN